MYLHAFLWIFLLSPRPRASNPYSIHCGYFLFKFVWHLVSVVFSARDAAVPYIQCCALMLSLHTFIFQPGMHIARASYENVTIRNQYGIRTLWNHFDAVVSSHLYFPDHLSRFQFVMIMSAARSPIPLPAIEYLPCSNHHPYFMQSTLSFII